MQIKFVFSLIVTSNNAEYGYPTSIVIAEAADDTKRTKAAKTAVNRNLICINQLLLMKPR